MLSKAHLTSHSRMSGSNTVLNQLAWTTRDKLAAPNFAFIGLLQWRALHNRGNVKQRRKKSTIMIGFGCKKSEVTQLCLTLCDSMDCSLPGSSVHGIFQARFLERVASRGSSQPRDGTYVSWISWISRQILYHCATWEAHRQTDTHTHTLFQFLFHYRSLQKAEYSSLCHIGVDSVFYR